MVQVGLAGRLGGITASGAGGRYPGAEWGHTVLQCRHHAPISTWVSARV